MGTGFVLDWVSGSSAVLDLQAAADPQGGTRYLLRYTSPFRPTMRSPQQALPSKPEFEQLNGAFDRFAARWIAGLSRGPAGAAPAGGTGRADLDELGQQLFELVLPRHVRADLRRPGLFLELGADQDLLHLPWELMHDGEDFVSLKHFPGRYVNLHQTPDLRGGGMPQPGTELGELRVLVVAVPRPKPQGNQVFSALPSVERERDAIIATLGQLGVQVSVLADAAATYTSVLRALRDKYHIIHFSGHAAFDPEDTGRSFLVLDDDKLSVSRLTAAMAEQSAVLCVVNACETTRSAGPAPAGGALAEETLSWRDQYNIFGLARAFLDNGAYVLGSRWKLPDDSAQRFAETFYRSFLGEGKPIGQAITAARQAVRSAAAADDFSWASYVYYGDPRVCLLRSASEQSAAEQLATAEPASEEPTLDAGGGRGQPPGAVGQADGDLLDGELADIPGPFDFARADLLAGRDRTHSSAALEGAIAAIRFPSVKSVLQAPSSEPEEVQALRDASQILPNLSPEQRRELASLLAARATSPELLGTNRLLLTTEILGRLGDSGVGNPTEADFQ